MDTRCICWYNCCSLEFHSPPEVGRKRTLHPVSAGSGKQEPMSLVHVFNLITGAFGSFLLLGLLSEGPACLRVGSDDGRSCLGRYNQQDPSEWEGSFGPGMPSVEHLNNREKLLPPSVFIVAIHPWAEISIFE